MELDSSCDYMERPVDPLTTGKGAKKLNYSHEEKELIKSLIEHYPVLRITKNDKRFRVKKQLAWYKVTKDYNNQPNVAPRTVEQLKKAWQNIKYKELLVFEEPDCSGISDDNEADMQALDDIKTLTDMDTQTPDEPSVIITSPANMNTIKIRQSMSPNDYAPILEINGDGSIMCVKKERNASVSSKSESGQEQTYHFTNERDARLKQVILNIRDDRRLYKLQLRKEKRALQREKYLLEYDKSVHKLEIRKLELEIRLLYDQYQKTQNSNDLES